MIPSFTQSILLSLILLAILISARLLTILPPLRGRPKPRRRGSPTHLLVVLGSGGHTGEMFTLLQDLDTRSYTHRSYIVGEGDSLSLAKATKFEQDLRDRALAAVLKARTRRAKHDDDGADSDGLRAVNSTRGSGRGAGLAGGGPLEAAEAEARYGSHSIARVPRARRIHQPLYSTPLSCLYTLAAALRLLARPPSAPGAAPGRSVARKQGPVSNVPDLILANGPATSAIVILASLLLRFLDLSGGGHAQTRIVYIESFARVSDVSLSGKCVAWVVDRFVVQWEELKGAVGGRAEYHGLLSLNPDEMGGRRNGGGK